MSLLERIDEEVEEIRCTLQSLQDDTRKQPFYSPPTIEEMLQTLAGFMEKDLERLIRSIETVQSLLDEMDDEEESA